MPAAKGTRFLDTTDRRERIRERRRNRPQRRFDTTVASPCIAVCQIDNRTGLCLGCFRNIDEIREWPILTAEQKTEILEKLAQRKAPAG